MTTIAYITNNIAPFRVALLDELATHADVTLYYVTEIDEGVNPQYVAARPQRAKLASIKQLGIPQTLKQLRQADAIIFDGYAGREKWLLLLGCVVTRTRYAISVDGLLRRKDHGVKRYLKQFALGHAHLLFSTGEATDAILRQLAPHTTIVRHAFTTLYDQDVAQGLANRAEALEQSSFHKEAPILFVGKFLKTKGVYEFVEATRTLNRPKIMVGGTVEALSELGVQVDDSYTVIPFLEREGVYQLMQQVAVFVLPTYTDSWGLVIVEALSNGVPVVTTTACNAGLALVHDGQNGYLVQKETVQPLKDAIVSAMLLPPSEVLAYNKAQMSHYSLEDAARRMFESLRGGWTR